VAIQYHHAGSFVPGIHRLPLEALDAVDGKDHDGVTIEGDGKQRTLLIWADRGVPRQASFDAPKPAVFPEVPTASSRPMNRCSGRLCATPYQ